MVPPCRCVAGTVHDTPASKASAPLHTSVKGLSDGLSGPYMSVDVFNAMNNFFGDSPSEEAPAGGAALAPAISPAANGISDNLGPFMKYFRDAMSNFFGEGPLQQSPVTQEISTDSSSSPKISKGFPDALPPSSASSMVQVRRVPGAQRFFSMFDWNQQ